jgi:hypothetical protein
MAKAHDAQLDSDLQYVLRLTHELGTLTIEIDRK